MNVPNLPTDNLYKFVAVFGLILFVFSHYLDFKIYEKLTEMNYSYNVLNQSYVLQQATNLQYKNEEIMFLTNLFDRNIPKDTLVSSLKMIGEMRDIDSANVMLKSLMNKNSDIGDNGGFIESLRPYENFDTLFDQTNDMHNLVKSETIKADRMASMSDYLFWTGLMLMFYGFGSWYYKFQRYIDAETKHNKRKYLDFLKKEENIESEE